MASLGFMRHQPRLPIAGSPILDRSLIQEWEETNPFCLTPRPSRIAAGIHAIKKWQKQFADNYALPAHNQIVKVKPLGPARDRPPIPPFRHIPMKIIMLGAKHPVSPIDTKELHHGGLGFLGNL
jgi:hypothetical protein